MQNLLIDIASVSPHKGMTWNKKERGSKKVGEVAKNITLLTKIKAVCGSGIYQALSARPSNYEVRLDARCEGK
jgi:hypothetical protein